MNKTCSVEKIDNGFIVRTNHDPNDYSANLVNYEQPYAPTVQSTVFAGSPEALGAMVAGFYANE